MTEKVQFSEQEINEIKSVQKEYVDIQNAFGQIQLTRLKLSQQLEMLNKKEKDLSDKFISLQNNETNLLKQITEKYGDGQLDLKTGSYIKN